MPASNGFPIVGPSVGRLLYQLTLISGAEEIIELGSGFGYSAYWFGKALSVLGRGRVILTDASPDNAEMAKDFLSLAGLTDKVEIKVGDALEIFDGEKGPFDIIFNDVDKECIRSSLERRTQNSGRRAVYHGQCPLAREGALSRGWLAGHRGRKGVYKAPFRPGGLLQHPASRKGRCVDKPQALTRFNAPKYEFNIMDVI